MIMATCANDFLYLRRFLAGSYLSDTAEHDAFPRLILHAESAYELTKEKNTDVSFLQDGRGSFQSSPDIEVVHRRVECS